MSFAVEKIATPEPVAAWLRALDIASTTYAHAPVFTCEEGDEIKKAIPGGHTKNLFLKDKKGQLWLVTALMDTAIDLKWLPQRINAARLSFGSPELLQEVLGVTPGSVTVLALKNDHAKRVTPILDKRLFDHDTVNCHPLINDKTTSLAAQDLLKFIKGIGYDPLVVDFVKG